ncbi:class I SAM-dependent methyltransferase [Halocatena marina]|uniref:class I SAM-dependent methyltransferase n=1 Tax=Halocatena marina TaxID=2934937 RepID=UPI0036111296
MSESDLTPESNIQKCFSATNPQKIAYQDECVVEISKPHLTEKIADLPENELESGRENHVRHIFHNHLVSTLVSGFSSEKIKNTIMENVDKTPRTILDASCGDDGFIFQLNDRFDPDVCVANDISWKTLSLLQKHNTDSNIIFTNHNLRRLPFDFTFDLVLFKNTLHHIEKDDQHDAIQTLNDLSDQLIIVDIEDPREYNFKSKAWNWYYRTVLGDEGQDFLSAREFRRRIHNAIGDDSVEFDAVETVKGNYVMCSARPQ